MRFRAPQPAWRAPHLRGKRTLGRDALARTQADEKVYTAECRDKHGFREKFSAPTPVSFAQFREITVNWAIRLQRACLLSLRSDDYVRLKNTLHVLSRLIKARPAFACQESAGVRSEFTFRSPTRTCGCLTG